VGQIILIHIEPFFSNKKPAQHVNRSLN